MGITGGGTEQQGGAGGGNDPGGGAGSAAGSRINRNGLIILNKNLLEDIHNSREIRYVMKDETLYKGDTLDEIWLVERKCSEWKLNEGK